MRKKKKTLKKWDNTILKMINLKHQTEFCSSIYVVKDKESCNLFIDDRIINKQLKH
jgi:hypothetical protein